MKKKSIAGIGIGIAVVIVVIVVFSSTALAPNTGTVLPSNASTGGISAPLAPSPSTPTVPVKKSYTLELNESVGIATK